MMHRLQKTLRIKLKTMVSLRQYTLLFKLTYETESGMVDYDVVTTMTDAEVQSEIDYTVEKVVEITVDTPVETTNKEAVSVLVTSTAPAP